jgi:hypothetical protein
MSLYPAIWQVQARAAARHPFSNAAQKAGYAAQRWLAAWQDMAPAVQDADEPEPEPEPEETQASTPVDPITKPRALEMAAAALVALDDLAQHPGSTVSDIAQRTRLDPDAVQYVLGKQRDRGHLRITATGATGMNPHWRYWKVAP